MEEFQKQQSSPRTPHVNILTNVCLFFGAIEKIYLLGGNFISGRPHIDLLIDVDAGDDEENPW